MRTIRKTLTEIESEGVVLPDGTLQVYGIWIMEYTPLILHFNCLHQYHLIYFIYPIILCRCGKNVSVVYFRAGYSPDDYPSEAVCISFIGLFFFYMSFFNLLKS